jgi:hypothetical protein
MPLPAKNNQEEREMKILIVFYSASGHIHRMDEERSLKAAGYPE